MAGATSLIGPRGGAVRIARSRARSHELAGDDRSVVDDLLAGTGCEPLFAA